MLKLGESFEVLILGVVVAGNRYHWRSIWLAILYSASRERSITIFVVSFVRRRSIKYIFYLEWYSAYFFCPLSPMVRQLTCNEQIVGSNPTGGSIMRHFYWFLLVANITFLCAWVSYRSRFLTIQSE